MEFNSLAAGLKVFMSRAVAGAEGEDFVAKAERRARLMPVLENAPGVYGYVDENRHMVSAFEPARRHRRRCMEVWL